MGRVGLSLHKFCNSRRKLVKMLRALNNNGNLGLLARYDFLDLCLLGVTGKGKTHTARPIHDLSPRAKKPFVAVNGAELTSSIIASGLFRYEKGAFTGATTARDGKFEAAAAEDRRGEECNPSGGGRSRPVDFRIVYAAHRDPDVIR